MSQNNKISKSKNNKILNSQNIIENSKNSTHLIEDKSDDEDDIISWNDVDTENDQDNDNNEDSDDSEENIEDDKEHEENHISHPEITFDVVEKNNKKSVKISINLDLEETSKMVNIEFCITKEIFLKIAKQLN
jgi:hypothetical protein